MPKKTSGGFYEFGQAGEQNDNLNAIDSELDFLNLFQHDSGETVSSVRDDLDLNSFVDFDAQQDSEYYEPIQLGVPEKKARSAKKKKEDPNKSKPRSETAEPPAAEPDPAPVPTEELSEETEYEAELPPSEVSEPETEPEPQIGERSLFARFARKLDVSEDDAPVEEETPKSRRLRSLFSREEEASDGEPDDSETDDVSEEKKDGLKSILSFFSKASPEKEKFLDLMQSKDETDASEEPEPDEKARKPERRTITVRNSDLPAADIRRNIAREPKYGEMLVYDSELDDIDFVDSEDLPEKRDYLPVRFRRYGTSGIGGGLMYAIFVISLSIVLACMGWMFASDVLALSKDYVESVVVVEPYIPRDDDIINADGDPVDEDGNVITCDIDQVAAALHDGEIIDFEFLFKAFSKLSHAYYKIDPGTYDVSTKLDYRALVTEMQIGSESQEITRITFPEGYTIDQIFAKLEENGICDAEDLYEAAANHDYSYSWLEDIPLGEPTRLEGYLFPDTYDFYQGENAVSVINRFLLRFHGIITADMYQQAENQGVTLHEAVIMASLIEKEAGPEDDRGNFSSVIYKRLNNDWPLQLDSTINYINNTSTFDISYADMETDSPYNTYLYAGLPAGPICSPGMASLNAALNPNSTNYWYWYAYDGVSYFFSDSSDFDQFAYEHPHD